jgi:hypothetical protein
MQIARVSMQTQRRHDRHAYIEKGGTSQPVASKTLRVWALTCFVLRSPACRWRSIDHANDQGRTHQSRPSSSPSPLMAQALCMAHCRPLRVSSPKPSETSASVMALGWSLQGVRSRHCGPRSQTCLFAKTSSLASLSSSSLSMDRSSALEVGSRSRSDDGLGVGVVAAPVWPDRCLAPQVPHLVPI